MLPFLKSQSPQVKDRTPDQDDQDSSQDGLKCAQDLLNAIENKDLQGIADALQDYFEIAESNPHSEGPHTYQAQAGDSGSQD